MLTNINLIILLLLCSLLTYAQVQPKIPLMRQLMHENIAKSQRKIDRLDGAQDQQLSVGDDRSATKKATDALFITIKEIALSIETDTSLDANYKFQYLRGLNEVLSSFELNVRNQNATTEQIIPLTKAFTSTLELEKRGQSMVTVIEEMPLEIGRIIVNSFAFAGNPGIEESRQVLLRKSLEIEPPRILRTLQKDPDIPSADSLIKFAAYTQPEELYNYAQSGTELASRIRNHTDPLVKTISTLASMNTGRLYFPFLDNLYQGKMTMEEIEKNMEDKYKYFRMLVNTEIDYAGRFREGDTPLVMSTLSGMVKRKAVDDFINVINALHDSPDQIRMKVVEPLNAQELYYLCVMGDPEIYTSSYLKVYDMMFQRLKQPGSDSLLASVHYDFFKKFIKMAAGYNRLDHFINNMDKPSAEALMRSFASNLEKTTSLEDAVDVADSYASISNKAIRKLIFEVIQSSYATMLQSNNNRGIVIYDILNSIFQSLDENSKLDISAKFGIPPVYSVKNGALKNDAGRIIIQQFFYGDKDGNYEFNNFLRAFGKVNWKRVNKAEWIEVSSTRGIPVTIYSNRPLDATPVYNNCRA